MLRMLNIIKYLEPKLNWNEFTIRGFRIGWWKYSIFNSEFTFKIKIDFINKFQKFKSLKFYYFYNDIQCDIEISKHELAANIKQSWKHTEIWK